MGIALLKKLNTHLPDSVKLAFAPIIRWNLIYNSVFQKHMEELNMMDNQTYAEIESTQFIK